jgi:hypothetical protein
MTKKKETETSAPGVVYRYVGRGDYFHGVPPRDLTADDLAQLTDEQKENVTKSTIYAKDDADKEGDS